VGKRSRFGSRKASKAKFSAGLDRRLGNMAACKILGFEFDIN
jgi:hypothetical protein